MDATLLVCVLYPKCGEDLLRKNPLRGLASHILCAPHSVQANLLILNESGIRRKELYSRLVSLYCNEHLQIRSYSSVRARNLKFQIATRRLTVG